MSRVGRVSSYSIEMARGPRRAERRVLDRIGALRQEAAGSPSHLAAPPVLVVVPSRSLRLHLLRRLAGQGGPEVAVGVRCTTAYGIAAELSGVGAVAPPDLTDVLAERFAREESALAPLARLTDGYAVVIAAVRDLLDAGYEPAHLEGLLEALQQPAAQHAGPQACRRAAALLRVAARVEEACDEDDLPARHRTYRQATTAVLRGDGPRLQAVVIHGFAEATGVVSDLLEALLKVHGGCVVLDRPEDPFVPAHLAAGGRFSERLLDRLRGGAERVAEAAAATETAAPGLLAAPRPETEVEEIAHRVLDRIAGGQSPEGIGVVMRDPAPYRLRLRQRFTALGVPFSAQGVEGASLPYRRRITSLLALLEEGERLPVDRWLELLPAEPEAAIPDLTLALVVRGAGRLAAAAALPDAELQGDAPVRLPVRRLRPPAAEEGEEAEEPIESPLEVVEPTADARDRPPEISRPALRRTVERARATMQGLTRLRGQRTLQQHLQSLCSLLDEALGWTPGDAARREIEERVYVPTAALPPDWPLGFDELRRALAGLLADAGREPLGGNGAGVQVLDVVAARGRTFDHLFVLGMQRGSFPRQIREDALLPEALRNGLATHGFGPLPDLPRKRAGHDEELHLFAQLLAAAPEVCLSWSQADAEGDPLSRSPWIDRLRSASATEPQEALAVWGDPARDGEIAARRLSRRPPDEWARLAGLHGSRADFARVFPHAVSTTLEGVSADAATVSRARLAVLEELDPAPGTEKGRRVRQRLGPFAGLVGPPVPDGTEDVWVTRLEAMALCPWQHFLVHTLRLESWPDPLFDLPALDAAVVGRFVHTVLQELATREGAASETSLAEALAQEPVRVRWPSAELLRQTSLRVARELLASEGILLPGLAAGLVESGRPMLEWARELLWEAGEIAVAGSEVEGQAELAGSSISFRADLAVRDERGLRLIDFKTSRPLADNSKQETRRRHLLAAIARGDALQAAAYATSGTAAVAAGTYSYLTDREVRYPEARSLSVDAADAEALTRARTAVSRLLAARRWGLYPPRLNRPQPGDDRTPAACSWCAVRQACLQGESTARIRQRQWVDRHEVLSQIADPQERALAALWWMRDPDWPSRHEEAEP